LFLPYLDEIAIKGHQKKGAESPSSLIGLVEKVSTQHYLVEETLRKVFCLLIFVSLTAEIAIDRLPILIDQKTDEGLILVVARADLIDKGPMCSEKCSCNPAYFCIRIPILHV
jgi:hypothetical protein